jgi:hypothetical protein
VSGLGEVQVEVCGRRVGEVEVNDRGPQASSFRGENIRHIASSHRRASKPTPRFAHGRQCPPPLVSVEGQHFARCRFHTFAVLASKAGEAAVAQ